MMRERIVRIIPLAGFILTLIGLTASFLSFRTYLEHAKTTYCGFGEGSCTFLYSVPEAKILGIHFSLLAPIYFSIISVLHLFYYLREEPRVKLALALLYFSGLAFVPYLINVEYTYSTVCLYCTIMHIVILANSMIFAYSLIKQG
ncbi:MAG: hypothetical protein F7C32_02795 [Desulfurococcales archaeon]|nr:hypothetical protein [Desulfurococcales archaeon]